MLVTTTSLALLFGGFVLFERANEAYAPLFSQLDREDAATIVAKLKELKVPYRVGADGTTVEVPESKARELRLELAGAGLPRGGGVGFESFDKMRLGATDFEQRVLYRRALEGELARTITTLGAVESARVHLVMPEKSVFISRSEPASGSIALRLHAGRAIGPSEVAAIVHLVASAVPGLEADKITVVTTDGAMLHRPRGSGQGSDADNPGGEDDARAISRSYETSMEDRLRAMLERVVGPGHADVRITADIDPARVERLEEHYDPTRSALRSEEQSIERGSGELEDTVAGVPGAESNLPSGAAKGSSSGAKAAASGSASASASAAPSGSAAPVPALAAGSVRESHTRNYELDKVTEKRVVTGGALRRLTVAVVLDGVKSDKGLTARPREELDKLAALVRSAAGASEARGDQVTVESMPFVVAESEAPIEPPHPTALQARLELVKRFAPLALGAVLVLALGTFALRRRSRQAGVQTLQLSAAATPTQLEAALTPMLDSSDLRSKAHARAVQDPATAALVLRFWLGTSAQAPTAPSHQAAKAS
jgi:flagellar M-ring protein FliF